MLYDYAIHKFTIFDEYYDNCGILFKFVALKALIIKSIMEKTIKKDYEAPSAEVLKVDVGIVIATSVDYHGFGEEDDLSGGN